MKLNKNFNQEIESLINSSEALSDWFEKNQESMAYFELTHPGCLHFDNSYAHLDYHVLGKMANACLEWLETPYNYTDEEKVQNAINSIAFIYDKTESLLSPTARELYAINVEELEKKQTRSSKKSRK